MKHDRRLQMSAMAILMVLAVTLTSGCGRKKAALAQKQSLPTAEVIRKLVEDNDQYGSEVSAWNEWAIIRDRSTESGDMPASLMCWQDGKWKLIASTTEGYWFVSEVRQHIPNLTPEGIQALELIEETQEDK